MSECNGQMVLSGAWTMMPSGPPIISPLSTVNCHPLIGTNNCSSSPLLRTDSNSERKLSNKSKTRPSEGRCHGRARASGGGALKFHNFIATNAAGPGGISGPGSQLDGPGKSGHQALMTHCLREEHGTKQITVSHWKKSPNASRGAEDGHSGPGSSLSSSLSLSSCQRDTERETSAPLAPAGLGQTWLTARAHLSPGPSRPGPPVAPALLGTPGATMRQTGQGLGEPQSAAGRREEERRKKRRQVEMQRADKQRSILQSLLAKQSAGSSVLNAIRTREEDEEDEREGDEDDADKIIDQEEERKAHKRKPLLVRRVLRDDHHHGPSPGPAVAQIEPLDLSTKRFKIDGKTANAINRTSLTAKHTSSGPKKNTCHPALVNYETDPIQHLIKSVEESAAQAASIMAAVSGMPADPSSYRVGPVGRKGPISTVASGAASHKAPLLRLPAHLSSQETIQVAHFNSSTRPLTAACPSSPSPTSAAPGQRVQVETHDGDGDRKQRQERCGKTSKYHQAEPNIYFGNKKQQTPSKLLQYGNADCANKHGGSRAAVGALCQAGTASGPTGGALGPGAASGANRSAMKQKLEDAFKQNGFLVKTKQVSDGEATFCKFRQLRKYTRYYLKSWHQHLPDEVNKLWKGFLPPKTAKPSSSSSSSSSTTMAATSNKSSSSQLT